MQPLDPVRLRRLAARAAADVEVLLEAAGGPREVRHSGRLWDAGLRDSLQVPHWDKIRRHPASFSLLRRQDHIAAALPYALIGVPAAQHLLAVLDPALPGDLHRRLEPGTRLAHLTRSVAYTSMRRIAVQAALSHSSSARACGVDAARHGHGAGGGGSVELASRPPQTPAAWRTSFGLPAAPTPARCS